MSSVLNRNDIDQKDFSEALPAIADKVLFLVNGLYNTGYVNSHIEGEGALGLGHILMDVARDLRKISDALYPLDGPRTLKKR